MGLRRAIALRLLPAYSGGALPTPVRRWMGEVVATDVDVAVAYELLRQAERRLGGDDALSSGQQELLLRRLLDDADDADESRAGEERAASFSSLVPALGAVACAGLFFVLPVATSSDDLTARGAAHAPLGVHVRCVVDGAVVDQASAGARQTGTELDCADGGLLAFSTTNLSPAAQFAFVIGVDSSSRPIWLPPFSSSSTAVAIAAGTTDDVLSTLARLPATGDVTLFVLLSPEPFSGADVQRRLEQAGRAGVPLRQLERLPVDVDTQARLTVRRPR